MTINTKTSLSGFIASDPDLTFTVKGDARFYARVGQPQSRREEDGTFTDLEPIFTDMVMFRKSAERAHAQFRNGDNFIAEGEVHHYSQTVDGVDVEKEQFVASRIGHDNNITTYEVARKAPSREDVGHEDLGVDPLAFLEALATRNEALEPEPTADAATTSVGREGMTR